MSSIVAIMSRLAPPSPTADARSPEVLLSDALRALSPYGPDKTFLWASERAALGGNLLHLLPEDRFDRLPLWTRDRSACLIADVRLDNRDDLARVLGLVHPAELADSAILLAAWERWGADCLDHILGGFAFAVWTPARRELFAARDHTGERPLFFYQGDTFFALASMPKGILAIPGVDASLDEQQLMDALVLEKPDWHRSCFARLQKLPMGHFLRITPDGLQTSSYWHPSDAKPTRYPRDQDYVEAFLEIFDRAVAARLRTTGKLGAELSGGLDSSSVTASAARLLALQGQLLTAFTAVPRSGFNGKGPVGRLLDEGPAAAEVVACYDNLSHVLLDTRGSDLLRTIQQITGAQDAPVQNGVNQLWVSTILEQARQRGISVVLQGALGNATISYDGKVALTGMFRRGEWLRLASTVSTLRDNGHISFRIAAARATSGLLPRWLQRAVKPDMSRFSLDYSAINPRLAEQHHLLQNMRLSFYGDHPTEKAERAAFFERFDFGPFNAAVRAVYRIDPRDPCGDKRVFDFCYSIPTEQYLAGGMTRSLIRRAMRGRLPQSTLTRTVRGLQGADWYLAVGDALPDFRQELARVEHSPAANHYLDLPRLKSLAQALPSSGFETGEVQNAWNHALCEGIAFGYFLRQHDSPGQT